MIRLSFVGGRGMLVALALLASGTPAARARPAGLTLRPVGVIVESLLVDAHRTSVL